MLTLKEKKKPFIQCFKEKKRRKKHLKRDNIQIQQAISKAINTTGPIAL